MLLDPRSSPRSIKYQVDKYIMKGLSIKRDSANLPQVYVLNPKDAKCEQVFVFHNRHRSIGFHKTK